MKEKILENIICFFIQWGKDHKLPYESQTLLHKLVEKVIIGKERFLLSEQINLFNSFDHFSTRTENISAPQQFIALANHYSQCPLGIIGNAIFVSHELKKATDIEPFVIQGMGRSIVFLLREKIYNTTNIILVGGKSGNSEEIKQILRNGKSIIFYPEGRNSISLKQGNFKAGRVILHSAKEGIPLLPVGFYFKNNVFNFKMGDFLNKTDILTLGSTQDKMHAGQTIVDYAMRKIANLLPEDLHGFYKA